MDKLNFLTAGIPLSAKDYSDAFSKLREMNLDGLEVEFVHGVRMSEKTQNIVLENKKDRGDQPACGTGSPGTPG